MAPGMATYIVMTRAYFCACAVPYAYMYGCRTRVRVCLPKVRDRGTAMPTARKKTALLDGLDQYSAYYSVICVFGSVVGCVVVPLITQVNTKTALKSLCGVVRRTFLRAEDHVYTLDGTVWGW